MVADFLYVEAAPVSSDRVPPRGVAGALVAVLPGTAGLISAPLLAG
nr:hypothetical protein [Nitrosomonas nitrosa]